MAHPVTWHTMELWIAALFTGLGAAALAVLVLGAAAGSAYRLFMLCSGKAVLWRRPRHRARAVTPLRGSSLAGLLDGGAGDDTTELDTAEVTSGG